MEASLSGKAGGFRTYQLFFAAAMTWYVLPIARAYLHAGAFMYLYIALFLLGTAFWCFECASQIALATVRYTHLVPLIAAIALIGLVSIGTGAPGGVSYVKGVLPYIGMAAMFFLLKLDNNIEWMGILFAVLIGGTIVTSIVGLIRYPYAIRTISYGNASLESILTYQRLNIANYDLVQCSMFLIPIGIAVAFYGRRPVIGAALAGLAAVFIVKASFSIALTIALLVTLLSVTIMLWRIEPAHGIAFAVAIPLLAAAAIFLLGRFGQGNAFYATRVNEVLSVFSGGGASGDFASRIKNWGYSLETFVTNPLGVGCYYEYSVGAHGIGYHSQILDDLARYGILAIAFYISFFFGYHRVLADEWSKIGCGYMATVISIGYALLLTFNLGLDGFGEAAMMMFMLPAMPTLLDRIWRDGANREPESPKTEGESRHMLNGSVSL